MAALRAMAAEDLGLRDPRTLLQSGNLVFGAAVGEGETIAGRLAGAVATRFGVETPVIVRSLSDIQAVIAAGPFAEAALQHPDRVLVAFLSAAPSAECVECLRAGAGPRTLRPLPGGRRRLAADPADHRPSTGGHGHGAQLEYGHSPGATGGRTLGGF
jgi:hypothetical protein